MLRQPYMTRGAPGKEPTELTQGGRCRRVVLGIVTGGRFSAEIASFIRLLAKTRAQTVSPQLQSPHSPLVGSKARPTIQPPTTPTSRFPSQTTPHFRGGPWTVHVWGQASIKTVGECRLPVLQQKHIFPLSSREVRILAFHLAAACSGWLPEQVAAKWLQVTAPKCLPVTVSSVRRIS